MRDVEEACDIIKQRTWRFIGTEGEFNGEGFNGVRAVDELAAFVSWITICMYL